MNRYHTLILHPNDDRVLAVEGTLPAFELPRTFWQSTVALNAAVRARFGIGANTLRFVDYQRDGDDVDYFYVLEAHTTGDGINWVPQGALTFAQEIGRFLTDYQTWRDTDSALRPAWYRRGWWSEMADWNRQQFGDVTLTQIRTSNRGIVVRVDSAETSYFLKAIPPMFAHEIPLNRYLSTQSDLVPNIITFDQARGWFVMANGGATTLESSTDFAQWEAGLRTFAQLQVDLIPHVSALGELGMRSQSLQKIAERFDALFEREDWLNWWGIFSVEEIKKLRSLRSTAALLCEELSAFDLPYSLDHGDLWPDQILCAGDSFRFIDWSDSTLTHPFFSYNFFHVEMRQTFPDVPDWTMRLRRAYLEPFTRFARMDTLQDALDIALKVAPLHYALLYARWILPNMDVKQEMVGMLGFFARQFLTQLSESR